MMQGLTIELAERTDRLAVADLVGDIDAFSAPSLERALDALLATDVRHVVLDLSAVGFVDSSGLGVIVEAFHRLKMRDGWLTLVCPHGFPRRIFERTGLSAFLGLAGTRAEALERQTPPR